MANLWRAAAARIPWIRRRRPATPVPAPPARPAAATGVPAPRTPVRPPALAPSGIAQPGQVDGLRRRRLAYAPELDGRADPGEIVWTWVPYEDDPLRGKDRPVLVIGRDGATVFGLMLSSQRDRDGQRHWLGLGPGAWDRDRRPSWVRLDRVITMPEDGIRREGAVLDRARFETVCRALRSGYGWC